MESEHTESGGERPLRSGARPLSERLESPSGGGPLDADDADEFVAEWADTIGGEEDLRRRLAFDDLAVESVRERLVDAGAGGERQTPEWLERVEGVVAGAASLEPGAYEELVEANADRPFVHATAPLVRAASDDFDFPAAFTADAVEDLEEWLLSRLTMLCRHPLFIQFKAFLEDHAPDGEPSADSTEAYGAFVGALLDDEFETVFETYPVLARYVGTVVGQWTDAVTELGARVASDHDAVADQFADGRTLGPVAGVETLSDDYHGNGRLVLALTFESGDTVVYKPRSVGPAAAFGRILEWTNDATELPDFHVPAVVERSEYGWMEHVPAQPCESESAVGRYYERVGGLVALAYLLGGTDLHFENLIAHGEHPVLVDLETALTPGDPVARRPESDRFASTFHDSVLETSMLPVVQDDNGRVLAGLGEPDVEQTVEHNPVFTDRNTDAMDLEFTREADVHGSNLPVLDSDARQPDAHAAALADGFEAVARTVSRQSDSFLAELDSAFRGRTMRYLYRRTVVYGSHLLRNSYSSHLRSGLRTGLQTEKLCLPFVDDSVSDTAHWRLVDCERTAIERRDVPRFTVEADERTLRFDGEPVSTVASSPLDRARRRVESVDPAAIETQLSLLELPFTTTEITAPASEPAAIDGGPIATAASPPDVVSNVVAAIREAVSPRKEGGLTWPDVAGPAPEDAIVFGDPGLDLYDGYAGVGLFLAAVASVRGDDTARELAYDVLEPVTQAAESGGELDDLGPGGLAGVGSVVYGLCRAGTLLDDADLVDHARAAGRALDSDDVAGDDQYDVVAGCAGELLGNLALYGETGDEAALNRGVRCGEHLLANRTEAETGHRVWRGSEFARPLSGFSHGAAGIGYALGRLGDATGRDEFLDGAREAIAFEATLFERDGGWVDRRDDVSGGIDSMGGWCHGRPGIGVGRLGVQSDVDAIDCRRELRRAVERRSTELSSGDSLCCGTAGRIRFLQNAGELLDDPGVVRDGDTLLDAIRSRATREGWARLKAHTPEIPRLSLFNGLCGVGYAALGAEADSLPNVTRLE